MSTRSFIGTIAPDGRFAGRYVYSDGYPTARGPVLTDILAAHNFDLAHVLDVLTNQHYGWSYLDAGTTSMSETRLAGRDVAVAGFGLAYTTHQGEAHPDDWIIGDLGGRGDDVTWCEWGYAFTGSDAETAALVIIGVEQDGDGECYHGRGRIPVRLLADLRAEDWTKIECGDAYERCCHYAWAHFDVPDESRRLGTRTWLGQVPLAPRDAIGATVDDRRYLLTGGGHDGGFYPAERNHDWYADAVDSRSGETCSIAIYRRTPKRGLIREIPRVRLHYPPTAHTTHTAEHH